MTWATINGIRIWNHNTFPEPDDQELTNYGWDGQDGKHPPATTGKLHKCSTCPALVNYRSKHCRNCYIAANTNHTRVRSRSRQDIDEVAVRRVLNGEWKLKTTQAERRQVCQQWAKQGRSMNELARLTGWRPERYYQPTKEAA